MVHTPVWLPNHWHRLFSTPIPLFQCVPSHPSYWSLPYAPSVGMINIASLSSSGVQQPCWAWLWQLTLAHVVTNDDDDFTCNFDPIHSNASFKLRIYGGHWIGDLTTWNHFAWIRVMLCLFSSLNLPKWLLAIPIPPYHGKVSPFFDPYPTSFLNHWRCPAKHHHPLIPWHVLAVFGDPISLICT